MPAIASPETGALVAPLSGPPSLLSAAPTDWAWAAGFIDGEGCLSVYRQMRNGRPHHGPKLSVANTHLGSMERLMEIIGGRLYTRTRAREVHVLYDLRLQGGRQLVPVINNLLPYLTVKREEAL